MQLNQSKVGFLTLMVLSINVTSVLSNKFITDILANNLLDSKKILQLLQIFFTAKLLKDYQDANGISSDPKTNYMLFLGKGNIQFQNHQLDVKNTTESAVLEASTPSPDLLNNKHLLKFVARNGYDVWKRFLVIPSNSSKAEEVEPNLPDDTFAESSSVLIDWIPTTNSPQLYFKPIQTKPKYNDKFVKNLKKLYKPNLQMIETKEGFIKHEVKPPKWVTNVIESGLEKGTRSPKAIKKLTKNNYIEVDRNIAHKKRRKKTNNKSGSTKSDKSSPNKYLNNKSINNVVINSQKKNSKERPTQKTNNKKQNTKVNREKQNNRIGNIVIKGFNGLFREIVSVMGIDSSKK